MLKLYHIIYLFSIFFYFFIFSIFSPDYSTHIQRYKLSDTMGIARVLPLKLIKNSLIMREKVIILFYFRLYLVFNFYLYRRIFSIIMDYIKIPSISECIISWKYRTSSIQIQNNSLFNVFF